MSTNTNGLHRHYDRLTPEERFRLDVLATARGDEKESEKLTSTCPRKAYTALDYGFSGRWLRAEEICRLFCLDLVQHLARLQMCDALKVTLPEMRVVIVNELSAAYLEGHEAGSRYAWSEAGRDGDPPGWEPLGEDGEVIDEEGWDSEIEEDLDRMEDRAEHADMAPDLIERLKKRTVSEALAVYEGFRRFTEGELGLPPEKVIAVSFDPVLKGVERLMEAKEEYDLAPDEKTASEYHAVCEALWKRHSEEWKRLSG